MIDFHNHVLPDVDDGPKTLDESMSMIRHASDQGITDIVQTVHFQHPKMDGKNVNYEYLINKVNILQKELDQKKIKIKIHLAAEVFFLPNLVDIINNPLVTIGNGKYMLIEFQTLSFPKGYEKELFDLQLGGVTPIIAHPERYREVQNNIDLLSKWKDLGYIIQLDAGSIIGGFGKRTRNVSHQMLKNNYCHLIGSDAHNNKKRNFCLKEALESTEKIIGSKNLKVVINNTKNIMSGNSCKNYNFNLKRRFFFNNIRIFKN